MSNKFKDIDIINFRYYFFNAIIDLRNFDPNNIKIDEKSYKKILIYYTAYVAIKDSKYLKINSVNSLYLFFDEVKGYFEEINGNKYLTLVPANESIAKMKKIQRTVD